MQMYKGFDKDLKCRGFEYEVGKEYEEDSAKLCEMGFHACENPIDVFSYYPPAESRYAEVDLDDLTEEVGDDSKRCGKRIKIRAEIGIKGIVDAFLKFTLDRIDWEHKKEFNTGDHSAATNTGDQSAATNTGNRSAATNTGYQSAATNTGYQSAATNTGDQSAATNTGNRSAATNTGNQSAATNTGNQSAATNTGYQSAAEVSGKGSVAISTGYCGKVKGALGCAIVSVERDNNMNLVSICSEIVDGEHIKPDVWYMVKNGDFVEVGG